MSEGASAASPPPLKQVYLVCGSDAPKVALAVRRLRARFPAGSVEELSAGNGKDGVSGEDAVASLNALGLFGGERLVIVREIDRWKAADVEAVATYLQAPAPGSVLALVGEPPRAGSLEKACAAAGDVLRFDVTAKKGSRKLDYPAWVREQFQRSGVRVDLETARALVDVVGNNTFALQAEVDKLLTWAAGAEIGPDDVARLAVPHPDQDEDPNNPWANRSPEIFNLNDAWGARDVPGALHWLDVALERNEPFLLGLRLAGQVARVRTARRVLDADGTLADVMKALEAKEYPARKAIGHADRHTADELDTAAVTLARLDHELKGASRLPSDLLMTRTVVELTERRQRHG